MRKIHNLYVVTNGSILNEWLILIIAFFTFES
jgi:hypothetical protein